MYSLRIYIRVLGLLGPEKRLAIVLALANVALAIFAFLEPMLFGRVVDVLTNDKITDAAARWHDTLRLLAAWAVVGIAGIVANILVALHADRLAHRRRMAALAAGFEHVLGLSFAFHGQTPTGKTIKIMLQGADNLFGLWLSFFREHLSTLVGLVVLLPISLFLNWRLGLLLIVMILIFGLLTSWVIRKTERQQAAVEEHHSALAARIGDVLGNVPLLQSFARLQEERDALGRMIQQVISAQFPVLDWWATVTVLTRLAGTVTLISIFLAGAWANTKGQASVGEIVTFMGFATMLIGKLDSAMGFVSRLSVQAQAIKEYLDLLATASTISDRPDAVDLGRARGEVEFDRVSFSHDGRMPQVNNLNFKAEPGQIVALVGHSGAGKSTAMSLLHRVYDPTLGRITVDGIDIAGVTLSSLRRNISVVFQEARLLNRTIGENMRLAKPDATEDEMIAAAKLAQAYDFIARLPNRFDSMIGERGARLSGGERQRLQIARAALKDAPILILDEATSALDTVTEAAVQQALTALMKGRTTFVIAHRLSTIRNADVILVMKAGEIVERGSFDVLMAKGGAFAELVQTQLAHQLKPAEPEPTGE